MVEPRPVIHLQKPVLLLPGESENASDEHLGTDSSFFKLTLEAALLKYNNYKTVPLLKV